MSNVDDACAIEFRMELADPKGAVPMCRRWARSELRHALAVIADAPWFIVDVASSYVPPLPIQVRARVYDPCFNKEARQWLLMA